MIKTDVNHSHRFVEAPNGVRLAVKEFGIRNGPTLMFIHGFSQSHLSWIRQVDDLVKNGYRVIAWDYPGHGDPAKPTDSHCYQMPKVWAGYLQAVLDGLNVGRAVLLGGMIIDDYIYYKAQNRWRPSCIREAFIVSMSAHPR